jgi:transcriptional regulator with PAS, ATPase and Fis domain
VNGLCAADTIVGVSESMVRLREYIQKVARSDANVLITGETGTGKERAAEIIHKVGPRKAHPFVCVNCAAIPDTLLESELLGHERGAFTGASEAVLGKLRIANGGTVFLDEIGEMSPAGQAKILRVLESREVFPLGAQRPVAVDVRFIAATNRTLEPLIAENKFRQDLYYRLNVARINLPPVKERKEDIVHLLMHYVGELNDRHNARVGRPSSELLRVLTEDDWPGNVREIRNLVEAVFIDLPSGPISLSDLPECFHTIFGRAITAVPTERDMILAALHEAKGNKSKAADHLHWSRMTLYRKLTKYSILTRVA